MPLGALRRTRSTTDFTLWSAVGDAANARPGLRTRLAGAANTGKADGLPANGAATSAGDLTSRALGLLAPLGATAAITGLATATGRATAAEATAAPIARGALTTAPTTEAGDAAPREERLEAERLDERLEERLEAERLDLFGAFADLYLVFTHLLLSLGLCAFEGL